MDRFLRNPHLLKGTPKLAIGNYVESQGILVPKRFSDMPDALAHINAGGKVIARSEHPREYASDASGILESLILDREDPFYHTKTLSELRQRVIATHFLLYDEIPQTQFGQFCAYNNLDYSCELGDLSYSLWEFIPGINHSIIADNVHDNRFHIFSSQSGAIQSRTSSYHLVDGDQIIGFNKSTLATNVKPHIDNLIALYRQVQLLSNFDVQQRPLMELQTSAQGQTYFLQYHPTNPSTPVAFTLNRDPWPDEEKALLVRGATDRKGIIVRTTLKYGWASKYDGCNASYLSGLHTYFEDTGRVRDIECASFDGHVFSEFSRHMRRKGGRAVDLIATPNIEHFGEHLADRHYHASRLIEAPISIVVAAKFYTRLLADSYLHLKEIDEGTVQVKLHIISDGRTCYVTPLRPEAHEKKW